MKQRITITPAYGDIKTYEIDLDHGGTWACDGKVLEFKLRDGARYIYPMATIRYFKVYDLVEGNTPLT